MSANNTDRKDDRPLLTRCRWLLPVTTGLLIGTLSAAAPSAMAQAPKLSEFKIDASDAKAASGFGQSVAAGGPLLAAGASGSVTLWQRQGTAWSRLAELTAGSAKRDRFGDALATSADAVVVGAPLDDDKGAGAGAVYTFQRAGAQWERPTKLTANDGAAGDRFGTAVAVSGGWAAVGAPLHDVKASDNGAVYVFTITGGPRQVAQLSAAAGTAGDRFGEAVAMAGSVVVAGAPQDDERGQDAGAAYVFESVGGTWKQMAKLTATDGKPGDAFGSAVAVSGDGILIGAPMADDGGSDAGAVYAFARSGSTWTPQSKLAPTGRDAGDTFGASLALSGNVAFVGAPLDDNGGTRAGAVHVFLRDKDWRWQQKVTASDAGRGAGFGGMVAIGEDVATVAAPLATGKNNTTGAIYVLGLPAGAKPVVKPAPPPAEPPTATPVVPPTPTSAPAQAAAPTEPKAPTRTPTVGVPTATRTNTRAAATATPAGPVCGNGVVEAGEACDPKAGACCSASCKPAADGDACDDGNPGTRNEICQAARCGTDVVVVTRVPPRYPSRASRDRVEGTVRLRFTVSAAGTVEDVEVVEAEPRRYFETAAQEAVAQYKYKPRMENGVAVKRPGVEVVLNFQFGR